VAPTQQSVSARMAGHQDRELSNMSNTTEAKLQMLIGYLGLTIEECAFCKGSGTLIRSNATCAMGMGLLLKKTQL